MSLNFYPPQSDFFHLFSSKTTRSTLRSTRLSLLICMLSVWSVILIQLLFLSSSTVHAFPQINSFSPLSSLSFNQPFEQIQTQKLQLQAFGKIKSSFHPKFSFFASDDVEYYDLNQEDDSHQIDEDSSSSFNPKRSNQPRERRWYGGKVLLIELGNIILPGLTYLFGGPAVHLSEGEGLKSLGSFGMRLGFPILGAVLFLASTSENAYKDGSAEAFGAVVGGILVGMLSAIVVDAFVLAYKDVSELRQPLYSESFNLIPSSPSKTIDDSLSARWMVGWSFAF